MTLPFENDTSRIVKKYASTVSVKAGLKHFYLF